MKLSKMILLVMIWAFSQSLCATAAGDGQEAAPCPPGLICGPSTNPPVHWVSDSSDGKMDATFKSLSAEVGLLNAYQVALISLCGSDPICKKDKYTKPYGLRYSGGVLAVEKKLIVGNPGSINALTMAIDKALAENSKINQLLKQLKQYTQANRLACRPSSRTGTYVETAAPDTSGAIPCDPLYTSRYELDYLQ